jgi:hypothetical protein
MDTGILGRQASGAVSTGWDMTVPPALSLTHRVRALNPFRQAPAVNTSSPDFGSITDVTLLQWLGSQGRRPNILLVCHDVAPQAVADRVTTWCQGPFHFALLPGTLQLPQTRTGTLVLHDLAALSLPQQIALYDWLSAGRGDLQIVSMTTTPLDTLVEQGDFLEGLYYRLNVVRLEATTSRRAR